DDVGKLRCDVVVIDLNVRNRRGEMLVKQLVGVRTGVWRLAGKQLKNGATETIDVGAGVEILVADLLGRHVAAGALDGRLAETEHRRNSAFLLDRNSEVNELDDPLVTDEEIIRL